LFVLPAGETSLSRADPDREGDAEGVCSAVSEEMRLAYVGLKNRWVWCASAVLRNKVAMGVGTAEGREE
jgi:hypothetical protein